MTPGDDDRNPRSDGSRDSDWWDRPPRPKRSPAPFVAVGALVLAFGGLGTYAFLGGLGSLGGAGRSASSDHADASSRRVPDVIEEPAALAPLVLRPSSAVADDVFAKRLMSFAIALDHDAAAGRPPGQAGQGGRPGQDAGADEPLARAEDALRGDDVRTALGPRAFSALSDLVTSAETASRAALDDEPSVAAVEIATAKLDNALVAERMPYFVDASVLVDSQRGKRLVLLYEFAIAATDLYASATTRVRAVRLHRLDRLNWSHTLLGFVNPYRAYAAVLLDQIEEKLVNQLLPVLADDRAPLVIFPPDASHGSDASPSASLTKAAAAAAASVADEAGSDFRAEAASLPGLDAAAARELGDALRVRRALFEKWNLAVRQGGVTIDAPSTFAIDVTAIASDLGAMVPRAEIDELKKIQKRLETPDVRRAYDTIAEAFVSSIERHEVQHNLDRVKAIPTPQTIDPLVPPGAGPASDEARDRIRSELSAYVAQIARDELMAKTTLTLLVRFLLDPKTRGGAESYAALVCVEELSKELGIASAGPILHDKKVDDARLARAHHALTAVPAATLASAAGRVWARLFGSGLAPLERLPRPQ